MKVAVITRHAIANYGSLLQAIATQEAINSLGHTCEIIDYIRTDESYKQCEKTRLAKKANWNKSWLKRIIYLISRQPFSIIVGKEFEKSQKKYLCLTQRYNSAEQLKKNLPQADVYMTGSDQVWGPVENGTYDDVYCLSFTDGKKISYAASFGRAEMKKDLSQYYTNWLHKYMHVSVREDSAVQMLNEIGIESQQVIDPTLLLDSNFWSSYFKPIKDKKYILVYQLHNNGRLNDYARKVADEKGMPLIRISPSFHQRFRAGKFVWCKEIGEFLSYIKNAECLITDSFHGTAFAINFNVPFVEVLPNNSTGTRNVSILKLTNLSGRILKDDNDTDLIEKKIDFTYANSVIEKEREKSLNILKTIIES